MYYCGIDISKYKHEATVIDETGKALLDSTSFANSKEGCEKLLSLYERLGVSKDDLLIGMEATSHYWLSVCGYLLEQSFETKAITPIRPEVFRKMYIRQTKDARKNSFGVTSKEVLSQYPTPEDLLTVSTRKLCNIIFAILTEDRPYEAIPPKSNRQHLTDFTM